MSKKAMISQPTADKRYEEIEKSRRRAAEILQAKGYEVINTFFSDEYTHAKSNAERSTANIGLGFLADSLKVMSCCHAVYFCAGWDKKRGCKIEHEAAVSYGLEIYYEEEHT